VFEEVVNVAEEALTSENEATVMEEASVITGWSDRPARVGDTEYDQTIFLHRGNCMRDEFNHAQLPEFCNKLVINHVQQRLDRR
jgi:hypothetical protein